MNWKQRNKFLDKVIAKFTEINREKLEKMRETTSNEFSRS